jgi:hypothetical protein
VLTVDPQDADTVYAEGLNHDGVVTHAGGLPHAGAAHCANVWKDFWLGDDPSGVRFFSPTSFAAFGDSGIYQVTPPATLRDCTFSTVSRAI